MGTADSRAHDAADLDAREPRQHEVEQHEVGRLGAEALEGLATVGRGDDAQPVLLERLGERLAQGRLVVDDEDGSRHHRVERARSAVAALLSAASRLVGPIYHSVNDAAPAVLVEPADEDVAVLVADARRRGRSTATSARATWISPSIASGS